MGTWGGCAEKKPFPIPSSTVSNIIKLDSSKIKRVFALAKLDNRAQLILKTTNVQAE